MKRPLIYSAVLHLAVVIFLWVGFYNPFEKVVPLEQPLMIEFVQVAEQSAAPHLAPEVMKKTGPAPQPAKPVPPAPPEPKVEPGPAPVAAPEPEPVKPEAVKLLPQHAPEPKPVEADPVPDPVAKPKPPVKPVQEKPKPQKVELNLDKKKTPDVKKEEIEKDKKRKPTSSSKAKPDDDRKKKPSKSFEDILSEGETSDEDSPSGGRGSPAATVGPVVTASEIDAIRQRIYKCWIVPSGARGARDMVVNIELDVARDGTVTKADIVEKGRMAKDANFRAAAESARRAVMDPRCNPLPIPSEKYDEFKHFTFGFNPKDMF